jgi:UDP-2,4-diacetamido-2,4,6-trideoxy-beta-L-altropyranose hydrolase
MREICTSGSAGRAPGNRCLYPDGGLGSLAAQLAVMPTERTILMHLRNAETEDARLLHDWANDPEVRSMAFASDPIEWEEHKRWFEKRLRDPNTQIYVAVQDSEPVGQIRFDVVSDSAAEVDVHTKPGLRGKGLGTQIISLGVTHFFTKSSVQTIHAIIKPENAKSRRAFEKAGFKEVQKKLVNGQECFYMVKERA